MPLEFLEIPPGQIMRKQVPSTKTKDVLDFATKRPDQRLESIRDVLKVFNYQQSQYMSDFGMHVDENPVMVNARVLVPPTLRYGPGSKQPTIVNSISLYRRFGPDDDFSVLVMVPGT